MIEFEPSLLEPFLATAARVLITRSAVTSAAIVANARAAVAGQGGGTWTLSLALPFGVYCDLGFEEEVDYRIYLSRGTPPRHKAEAEIEAAINSVADRRWEDRFLTKIVIALDDAPEWRTQINRILSGEGITNQGRVRSDNIAALRHEGLLFRSPREICFFDALKRAGVPFAPLPTVLTGRLHGSPKRIEPDFIIWKEGIALVVEIDGNSYHREAPADADDRLQCLHHEGVYVRRIRAESCDTPQKAVEAVQHCLAVLNKFKKARG